MDEREIKFETARQLGFQKHFRDTLNILWAFKPIMQIS